MQKHKGFPPGTSSSSSFSSSSFYFNSTDPTGLKPLDMEHVIYIYIGSEKQNLSSHNYNYKKNNYTIQ
jgi:hypothetical protein